ncbi:hypothetical protein [Streptomyces sp. NPDC047706]|uniref:hypothetical protein n=1 Tax=Streptomyces sp. NPDC047706 TaxID=3365486 RepID=UPI003710AC58
MARALVLGYSGGLDGTACLVADGRVLSWSRYRRGAPGSAAVADCLDAAGVGWRDVGLVVECAVEPHPLRPWDPLSAVPEGVPRVTVSRHDALARATAASFPFRDAAVAVVSCPGTARYTREAGVWYESDSLYDLADGHLSLRLRHCAPASRSALSTVLDFRRHVCRYVFGTAADGHGRAGGLAALASSGRPGRWSDAAALRSEGSRISVEASALGHLDPARARSALAVPTAADLAFHADVSRWAQTQIETAVLGQLANWASELPRARLLFTGSLAGDGALDRRVGAETPFDHVHLHAPAGERSAALGCGAHGLTLLTGRAVLPFAPLGRARCIDP